MPDAVETSYTVTTRLDAAVMRSAIRQLFWLRMRYFMLAELALALAFAAIVFAWYPGIALKAAVGLMIVSLPLTWVFGYRRFCRRSERNFIAFLGNSVTWTFAENTVAWEGANAQSRIAWKLLQKLYLGGRFWILVSRNRGFNVVPSSGIDAAVRDFVLSQAERHGVRIVNLT